MFSYDPALLAAAESPSPTIPGVLDTLRRIDATLVRREIEDAGFVLEAEVTMLRDPSDARDWRASDSATTTERGEGDRRHGDLPLPGSAAHAVSEPRRRPAGAALQAVAKASR